jgi:long-subunit acyl-CoA synthetase (AMP-forming)
MLGGRVRLIPCGAAPFKYEVLQFFRAALGAVVLEVNITMLHDLIAV